MRMVVRIRGEIVTRITRGSPSISGALITHLLPTAHRSIRRPSNIKVKTIVTGDDVHTNIRVTQSRSQELTRPTCIILQ